MTDDLSVKLYFGNGQIRYGEHGVDLSEFYSVDHVIRRAASRTWGSITEFFRYLLTVKFRQPSHEFTFGVGMNFISYPLVLTPVA
jgi:hypothetical protein